MKVTAMEPMMPRTEATALDDLAFDLVARANHLAGQVQPGVREGIGDLVRSMNCYYSNLIEGHDTHPRDIDAALEEHYSDDAGKRSLQREARAHIEVQRLIDCGHDPDESPTSIKYIHWLHREFYQRLPEEMLWVENSKTGERMQIIPGEFRDGEVEVGRHVPPPANGLPRFLGRFEEVYDLDRLPKSKAIIAIAASHHRFLWIHPFFDGNGRVARLMAHAMMLRSEVGCSIWSVSRGLARNSVEYKSRLMEADSAREGDLDGRGALSAGALERFCEFFLSTAIDQVEFMEGILRPGELLRRMKLYVDDEISANRLPPRSMSLLREAFIAGELERGRAPEITGYQERRGREILSELLSRGLLVSQGPRAPVRLGFPLDVVERWFPQLYPVS
jgi:Fic family protein